MGRKLEKDRVPFLDNKGNIIDDGKNVDISLGSNLPAFAAEAMIKNLQEQFPKRQWKFWIASS